ncbi:MAG: DUF4919 domain-containing protein [Paramuribaculum sp.]|nr:DUF4919 domain-containing protein [Paramuribaculum sp.]
MKLIYRLGAGLLATLLATSAATAQTPTHLTPQQIEAATADYTTMLPRFEAGTELPAANAAAVYFGAAKQKGFNPDTQHTAMLQAYESGNMLQAHQLAMKGLKSDPTNLTLLFKAYASAVAGNDADAKKESPKLLARIHNVCDAIFNSGMGVSEMSPYMVTHPSDIEEFILKYIRPTAIQGKSKLGELDVYKVTIDGIAEPVYLYFAQYK